MSAAADKKILKYMQDQNRPYSATDVLLNLHKEIGKTQVVKSLESLSKAGHLVEKVYGKQKIYFVNQHSLPSLGKRNAGYLVLECVSVKLYSFTCIHRVPPFSGTGLIYSSYDQPMFEISVNFTVSLLSLLSVRFYLHAM